jgi:transcriptional regulator with XRE-family HTH domain
MAAPGSTRLQQEADRRTRSIARTLGETIRAAREDTGVSQQRIADAAGISQPHLSEIEAGRVQPSLRTLVGVALALGGDASIRFYPGTGPRIRDRIQASMVEALLRVLHPRWTRFPEVPVYRPLAGVIDLVIAQPTLALLVASEFQSQLRRVEQQLRWARGKADSLASTSVRAVADLASGAATHPDRMLVLRSTREMRAIAAEFELTLAAAYPARTRDVFASLTTDAPWPGSGVLWVSVDGRQTHIMHDPPRGVRLGR